MLRDMSPQADTQREVVAMFWTRMEKVVKVPTKSPLLIRFVTCDQLAQVLVEEPNRPNIQVTFEKVVPVLLLPTLKISDVYRPNICLRSSPNMRMRAFARASR